MSGYLWALIGGAILALVAYLFGRSATKGEVVAQKAEDAAKASRARLEADLQRQDDDAAQRDAMEGVKPLPPGRK